jgi:hypothetical protein
VLGVVAVLHGGGRHLRDDASPPARAAGGHASSATTSDCRRSRRPVRVRLSRARWPHIADHVAGVRRRYPLVLHIDRAGADENREESLRGIPTRPGYDRDEYPPAVAREGGEGADVRLVRSSENRSAGAAMGNRLRPFCDGQRFRLVVR